MIFPPRSGIVLVAVSLLVGCSPGDATAAAKRVDRCTERILERDVLPPPGDGATDLDVRAYVRRGYCERFDAHGWVHDDGSLTIEAFTDSGHEECATRTAGGGTAMVSCDSLGPVGRVRRVDCALLDLVRRAEVRAHIARLDRPIECDDGTSLDELGVR